MDQQIFWQLWLSITGRASATGQIITELSAEASFSDRILRHRSELIDNVDALKSIVEEVYGEQTAFNIVFPILCFCDEKVNLAISESLEEGFKWNSLQSYYYQRVDGGMYFYTIIDELLSGVIQLPEFSVVSISLLLESGFKGKYYLANQHSVKFYLDKLNKYLEDAKSQNQSTDRFMQLHGYLSSMPESEIKYDRPHYLTWLYDSRFYYSFVGGAALLFLFIYAFIWWL
ncbi:DotU family type IV/VI secretion system protein [Fangia hongkongensis]|uniref:DotU family type IV/VI secretion system protein n=1 Tax=Fangia hongkongensis TaxID=270495 RepID=UPI0003757068|nr:DotU family type IV/VI secretion system protein [Fangia hongkongensis]MBK2123709.1 DotU family type IV/VI secretion system protein [Fangia hongkongensis]